MTVRLKADTAEVRVTTRSEPRDSVVSAFRRTA
jgi:hypothetical protein